MLETNLFISKHKEHGIPQFIFCQHSHQLLLCFTHSLPVIAVHYKDKAWKEKDFYEGGKQRTSNVKGVLAEKY